jgi:hypothetical protein
MSSRHLPISESRSSCLRSSLIGYLRLSFSSSCLHMVRPGGLADLLCATHTRSVAASVLLTRWRTRLRRAMNERDRVSPHVLILIHWLIHATRSRVASTRTACSTMRRSSTSMVKNMKANVIATLFGTTKPSSIGSLVGGVRASFSYCADTSLDSLDECSQPRPKSSYGE